MVTQEFVGNTFVTKRSVNDVSVSFIPNEKTRGLATKLHNGITGRSVSVTRTTPSRVRHIPDCNQRPSPRLLSLLFRETTWSVWSRSRGCIRNEIKVTRDSGSRSRTKPRHDPIYHCQVTANPITQQRFKTKGIFQFSYEIF